jgi:hypothetical protein
MRLFYHKQVIFANDLCKKMNKNKKRPALADEKVNNNPFSQQVNATLIVSASLLYKPEKTTVKSTAIQ